MGRFVLSQVGMVMFVVVRFSLVRIVLDRLISGHVRGTYGLIVITNTRNALNLSLSRIRLTNYAKKCCTVYNNAVNWRTFC